MMKGIGTESAEAMKDCQKIVVLKAWSGACEHHHRLYSRHTGPLHKQPIRNSLECFSLPRAVRKLSLNQ